MREGEVLELPARHHIWHLSTATSRRLLKPAEHPESTKSSEQQLLSDPPIGEKRLPDLGENAHGRSLEFPPSTRSFGFNVSKFAIVAPGSQGVET